MEAPSEAPPSPVAPIVEEPKPAEAVDPAAPAPPGTAVTADQIRVELGQWTSNQLLSGEDIDRLQILLKDHDGLKDKVGKLKSLLGRSAKAQREAKIDLDATQKRLEQALREIERLNQKVEKLVTRPSHMELLADFETNFDRALLAVGHAGGKQQQEGGQDTAPPQSSPLAKDTVVDGLLMQELNENRQRVEKLEGLNAALVHRSSQLEAEVKARRHERDELASKVSRLELEKRMAVMEAEQATKAMQEKAASLKEMQMEIDLVTKASATANARAAHGEEIMKTVKTDRQHVLDLEAKVQALQEWALASSEAKTLAQERARLLENQLRTIQSGGRLPSGSDDDSERLLFSKSGSLVVGAGDVGFRVVELSRDLAKTIKLSERVILRWRFDLTQDDATIDFSILKSACETAAQRKNADYLIKDRLVKGGAAGETENAFAIQQACTLLWSNVKSWIRPKTVKFTVDVIVVSY